MKYEIQVTKGLFFYLDESWVSQNHSPIFIWEDSTLKAGLKVPSEEGGRIIMLHAGSAKSENISLTDAENLLQK
jgi:hypothetical protein